MADSLEKALADKYADFQKIGDNGFSTVYKAFQKANRHAVVVKVFDAELAQRPDVSKRLRKEVKRLQTLSHPNLPILLDAGAMADGRPYLVLEFIEGTKLSDLISEQGPLPAERCKQLLTDLAAGLNSLHRLNIVHRDISPDNIVITEQRDGTACFKFADYGLMRPSANWVDSTVQLTQFGHAVGTPACMSPEQCRGEQLDSRSDIYSLACCVYQAMHGAAPFHGTTITQTMRAQLTEAPVVPTPGGTSHSSELLLKVLMRCLKKQPKERYSSCAELLCAIDGKGSKHTSSAGSAKPSMALVVGAGAACIVVIAGIGWSWHRSSNGNTSQVGTETPVSQQTNEHASSKTATQTNQTAAEDPDDTKVEIERLTEESMTYYNLGREHMNKADYTSAISEFTASIAVLEKVRDKEKGALDEQEKFHLAWSYQSRAFCLLMQNSYAAAIPDLSKAIELRPTYKPNYINRAKAYQLIGQPKLAEDDLALVRKMPDDPLATNAVKPKGTATERRVHGN